MTKGQMVARLELAAELLYEFDDLPEVRAAFKHVIDVRDELAGANDPESYSGTPV